MKPKITKMLALTAYSLSSLATLNVMADDDVQPQSTGQSASGDSVFKTLAPLVIEANALMSKEVDAFKTGTPILDIPQSLSLYTSERIQEQGIDSIGDIADYTPGINTSQGEGHRDAIVFRGVRSTADFFVDGIRDDVQYYRPLYNIDQVEVLRGPNALFFGRGGTGGLINRVTKKPSFTGNFNEYKASVDSFGGYNFAYDSNYVASKQTALRLNAHYDQLENHRDYYYGDQFGLNPTITHKFNEDTSVTFSLEHLNHERFIDRGIPTGADGKPVDDLRDVVFGDRNDNYSTFEANIFSARLNHNLNSDWKLRASALYGEYDKVYQNFYASDYDQSLDEVTIDGYRDTTQRDRFVFSTDVIGEFETGSLKHKVVLGTEYIRTSNNNDRFNANFTPDDNTDSDTEVFDASGFSLVNGVGRNTSGNTVANNFNTDPADATELSLEAFSFFVHDEIELNPNWHLVLGARYDHIDQDYTNVLGGGGATKSDNQISPRAGIIYKPVDNLSIYGSYSETFIPSNGGQYASVSDQLDPDAFQNMEIGIKYDIADDLSVTAAAYEIAGTFPADSGGGVIVETESELRGFELQLVGNITDKWFVSAGYSYMDGETSSGGTPREIPENSFSIWNTYKVTDKFGLGLGIIYQDDSFINNDDDADSNPETLPSYVRVDAAAYYDISDDCRVQLNIENLFDEDYYPNAHGSHQVTVGAPINARLGFTCRF
ncbi:MAG: TonB-dependent receptor [Akkermansiaceae bacterium]